LLLVHMKPSVEQNLNWHIPYEITVSCKLEFMVVTSTAIPTI
jgi:hypothetical protein